MGCSTLAARARGPGTAAGPASANASSSPRTMRTCPLQGAWGPTEPSQEGAKPYGGPQSDTLSSIFPGVFRPAPKSIPFCMARLLLDQLGVVDMSVLIEGEKFVEESVAGMQGGHWTIRRSFPTQNFANQRDVAFESRHLRRFDGCRDVVGGQACTLLVAEEADLPDPEAIVFQVGTRLPVVRTFHRSSLHSLFGGQKGVGSCSC